MTEKLEIQDSPVYSYALASGDMRYIEIGERDIYLRQIPQKGLIFRGEISGCGADCYAELNEILLEFAMSCEGCREQSEAEVQVTRFGEQIGKILSKNLNQDILKLSDVEKLSSAFRCILDSMTSKFTEKISQDQLGYTLDCCPLTECAINTGFTRSVEMAHLSFVALCTSLVQELSPDWVLRQPSGKKTDLPIYQILVESS